jgi:aspartate oxidase
MAGGKQHDVLIIGSGAAGLTAALSLARHCRVLVLAKNRHGPVGRADLEWNGHTFTSVEGLREIAL